MERETEENGIAWNHLLYEWRTRKQGSPGELAAAIRSDPKQYLGDHAKYFSVLTDRSVANICGSDGKRAVALALLGASATVFDISEAQKKYALELAAAAGVELDYVLGDFTALAADIHVGRFDYAYAEGGILNWFSDLSLFFQKVGMILKPGGILILSDYHPFQKTYGARIPPRNVELAGGNYFDTEVHAGHIPFYEDLTEEERGSFPPCYLRFYSMSEILNALIEQGLTLRSLEEHPLPTNAKLPGTFTLTARK